MQKILTIHDIFKSLDGEVILGGTNPELDSMPLEEIQKLVGRGVRILMRDGKLGNPVTVLDADASTSLVGKRNIFLKIASSDVNENVSVGCLVMSGS